MGWSAGDEHSIGNYEAGKWYDVTLLVDTENDKIDVAVMQNGTTIAERTGLTLSRNQTNAALAEVYGYGMQAWVRQADHVNSYFDDISFEYVSDAPQLSATSVSFFDGEKESKSLTAVLSTANKIVLDFGATMKESMMNSTNIMLTDVTDAAAKKTVTYNGKVEGNTYVMTLPENTMFGAGKKYTIDVSGDVQNVLGVTLGDDVKIEFETGAAVKTASLTKTSETDIKKLTQGATLTTDITYVNTSGNQMDMVLIYTYYGNNGMVKTVVKPVTLSGDKQSDVINDTHTVESLTDVTNIKVMLWDGLNTILPLSKAIDIK